MIKNVPVKNILMFVLLVTAGLCLPNSVWSLDSSAVVLRGAKVKKLAGGFSFTEGPAVDGRGNIYFSDIPNNRIHKWSLDGKLTTFLENSNGANGLFFDRAGNLLACEGAGRLVAIRVKVKAKAGIRGGLNTKAKLDTKTKVKTGSQAGVKVTADTETDAGTKSDIKAGTGTRTVVTVVPLAAEYHGKKFNSCNDLWITPAGGVYFTDPWYGKPEKMSQDGGHVYYLTPDKKKVVRVINDMIRPNGLIGTRDGKTLYVSDRVGKKTFRYKINPDGTLTHKTLFVEEGSDGMTIDTQGNIYITTDAVHVYSRQGGHIAVIPMPEQPSNVTFGGRDLKTLYITARKSLYSVRMQVKGYPAWCGAKGRYLTAGGQNIPDGYVLAYSSDFDDASAVADFEFTNPKKWRFTEAGNGSGALEFLGPGGYKPPVRSPRVIGLIADWQFGDFVLEADMLQTGRDYGHRDMCLFFGLQNPSRFYYVHIATKADPHAHNIFIVNDKPRTSIAKKTTGGINWGRGIWHRVRLERKISDGSIKLYYDDMTNPIMLAEDRTFGVGYIGFGSFDDTGKIDNIRIWSPRVVHKPANIYNSN